MSKQLNKEKKEKSRDTEEWWEEGRGDWWKTDRLDAIGWAAIFIWGALMLLVEFTSRSS